LLSLPYLALSLAPRLQRIKVIDSKIVEMQLRRRKKKRREEKRRGVPKKALFLL
jgi:hypothetical protein